MLPPRRSTRCCSLELAIAGLVVASVAAVMWRRSGNVDRYPGEIHEEDLLWVNITVMGENAIHEGAVCLDGSPPAYHLHRGSGSGSNNWLIHLEGGGWCSNRASCATRSASPIGSSFHMEKEVPFSGMLSNSPDRNPDFYNWNRVRVRYCDGASFSGSVDYDEQAQSLKYRGQHIWRFVMADLLRKGMNKAEKALLTGCSAGALAAILHCNDFKELLPQGTFVKCLNDGGFFIDVEDVAGRFSFRSFYDNVVNLHNVRPSLPSACNANSHNDTQCFFPQYFLPYIQVPIFFVNPSYDIWQLQNVLVPDSADPRMEWASCKSDPYRCSPSQLKIIQGFRTKFLKALSYAQHKDGWGLFINSCFIHCQTTKDRTWINSRVGGKAMREAVGDWYFNRKTSSKYIDCAYPCNPTCSKWTGWGHPLI